MEKVLLELHPDIDLEAFTSSSTNHGSTRGTSTTLMSPRCADDEAIGKNLKTQVAELLPLTSSGFDWEEKSSLDAIFADGMGTLCVNPHGVGYLGKLYCASSLCLFI